MRVTVRTPTVPQRKHAGRPGAAVVEVDAHEPGWCLRIERGCARAEHDEATVARDQDGIDVRVSLAAGRGDAHALGSPEPAVANEAVAVPGGVAGNDLRSARRRSDDAA